MEASGFPHLSFPGPKIKRFVETDQALWDQLHQGEKGRKVTEAVKRAIP